MKRKMMSTILSMILVLSLVLSGCDGLHISIESTPTEKESAESETTDNAPADSAKENEVVADNETIEKIQEAATKEKDQFLSDAATKRDIYVDIPSTHVAGDSANVLDYDISTPVEVVEPVEVTDADEESDEDPPEDSAGELALVRSPMGYFDVGEEDLVFGVRIKGGVAPYTYQWYYHYGDEQVETLTQSSPEKSNKITLFVSGQGIDYYGPFTVWCTVTDSAGGTVSTAIATTPSRDTDTPPPEDSPPTPPVVVDQGGSMERFMGSSVDTPIAVSVSDVNFPMINRLGCGYNVFGEYASQSSVGEPVLDLPALAQHGWLEAIRLNRFDKYSTISESIRGYSKSITHSAGISGGYLCFSGSVDTSFTSSQQKESRNYYATMEAVMQKYKTYIKGMAPYRNYLTKDAAYALNNSSVSPEKVFQTYGHYVLVQSIVGGKIVYNYVNNSTSSQSFENFKIDVEATFNAIIAKASGSYGMERSETSNAFDSTCTITSRVEGGTKIAAGALLDNSEFLQSWSDSLENEGNLVAFPKDKMSLIPIWELCNDPNRAAELEEAFAIQAKGYENSLPQAAHYKHRYVTAINLGLNSDQQKARSEAAMDGRQVLEPHANHEAGGQFCFLSVQWSEPGEWKNAITDLLVSKKHEGVWYEFAHHGQKDGYALVIKNESAKKGTYQPKWCNLNYEAGGDEIYLYAGFNFATRKAPIYDIMIYDANELAGIPNNDYAQQEAKVKQFAQENGWEIVNFAFSEVPANLNHNAGGHRLFLLVKKDYSMMVPLQ